MTSARAAGLLAGLDPENLAKERWFAGKGRHVESVELVDAVEAGDGVLAIADVRLDGAPPQRYTLLAGASLWRPLLELAVAGRAGGFRFRPAGGGPGRLGGASERPRDRAPACTRARIPRWSSSRV